MKDGKMLAKAISLASEAFERKFDSHGHPYILHCIRVMMAVKGDVLRQIAILHDVPEDTTINIDDLRRMGFSERVLQALECLTHRQGEYYDAYIKRVATNRDAVLVKRADLEDNTQVSRLKGLTQADFERMEKYHKAYTYLSSIE
jgi:(p)ppGpp synthase/HD superfamily hydrolase